VKVRFLSDFVGYKINAKKGDVIDLYAESYAIDLVEYGLAVWVDKK
jgi:hypothetical protein